MQDGLTLLFRAAMAADRVLLKVKLASTLGRFLSYFARERRYLPLGSLFMYDSDFYGRFSKSRTYVAPELLLLPLVCQANGDHVDYEHVHSAPLSPTVCLGFSLRCLAINLATSYSVLFVLLLCKWTVQCSARYHFCCVFLHTSRGSSAYSILLPDCIFFS